jgi:hypothetical protein
MPTDTKEMRDSNMNNRYRTIVNEKKRPTANVSNPAKLIWLEIRFEERELYNGTLNEANIKISIRRIICIKPPFYVRTMKSATA